MTQVINQISIAGPIADVFDIVTTTRYWPRWHPATIAVGGATERPLALGDVIHERARIGARVYKGAWSVAEHVYPERVVLRIAGRPIQITYAFESAGPATVFRRALAYQPERFLGSVADPSALERLIYHQSEAALHMLRHLVEELLASRAWVTV
jgi:Polyketide cyclase / dehydrase and lipid transport